MEYTGFWMRVIAYLIDAILMDIVVFGIAYLMAMGAEGGIMEVMASGTVSVLGIVIFVIYGTVTEGSGMQATVGKKIIGVRVADANGNPIGMGKALGRNLAKLLSGLILGIGFLMVAFTGKKQGLHDMIAGTLVVSR